MPAFRPLEGLSSSGEPVRALLFTYFAAAPRPRRATDRG